MSSLEELLVAMGKEIAYQDDKYGTAEERQLAQIQYWDIALHELIEAMWDIRNSRMVEARQEALQAMTVIAQWLILYGVEEREEQDGH